MFPFQVLYATFVPNLVILYHKLDDNKCPYQNRVVGNEDKRKIADEHRRFRENCPENTRVCMCTIKFVWRIGDEGVR